MMTPAMPAQPMTMMQPMQQQQVAPPMQQQQAPPPRQLGGRGDPPMSMRQPRQQQQAPPPVQPMQLMQPGPPTMQGGPPMQPMPMQPAQQAQQAPPQPGPPGDNGGYRYGNEQFKQMSVGTLSQAHHNTLRGWNDVPSNVMSSKSKRQVHVAAPITAPVAMMTPMQPLQPGVSLAWA